MPRPFHPVESLGWLASFWVTLGATRPSLPHPQRARMRQSPSQGQAMQHALRRLKQRRTHTPVSAMRQYRSTSCIKPLDVTWSRCSARPSRRSSPRCSRNSCRTCWTQCAMWCRRKCPTCLKCCSNRKSTNSSKPSSKINMMPENARRVQRQSAPDSDVLDTTALQQLLTTQEFGRTVYIVPSATSTNDLVKDLAQHGAPEGTAVGAGHQNQGRGRHGRSFVSPAGGGIYVSLLVRPPADTPRLPQLTLAMAGATAQGPGGSRCPP